MINLTVPTQSEPLAKPQIVVIGVGGAGGNAVNNMIVDNLQGVDFIVANTDAQAWATAKTARRIQLGEMVTQGLGAGAKPDIGARAAEESMDRIANEIAGANMVFITAGMGGGTGTGAAPVVAKVAREMGILTVGVVTKPFQFEGGQRMRMADLGIEQLSQYVDTLIVIPNQNLFRVANERTTFADAFKMADNVLHQGVRSITDLMIMPGLINLDFADVRTMMTDMGRAMMGTGESSGDRRALDAAEAAIANPLLEDTSMKGAKGVLINITGGLDITLFEVDEAANRIRDEVEGDCQIIFGSCFDPNLEGKMRVSVVATGITGASSMVSGDGRPSHNASPLSGGVPSARPAPQAFAAPPAPTRAAAPVAPTATAATPAPAPTARPAASYNSGTSSYRSSISERPAPSQAAAQPAPQAVSPRPLSTPLMPPRPATNPNAIPRSVVEEEPAPAPSEDSAILLDRLADVVPERAELELAASFTEALEVIETPAPTPIYTAPARVEAPVHRPAPQTTQQPAPVQAAPPVRAQDRQPQLSIDAPQPAVRRHPDAFIPASPVEHYSAPLLSTALSAAMRQDTAAHQPAPRQPQTMPHAAQPQAGLAQPQKVRQNPAGLTALRGEPRLGVHPQNGPANPMAAPVAPPRSPVSRAPATATPAKGSLLSRISHFVAGHPALEPLAERTHQPSAEPMAQDFNISVAHAPQQRHEEDELEIPTFLRRQVN